MRHPFRTLSLATGLVFSSIAAQAADRTLVSARSGADVAGCGTPAAPCRSFQFAHDNTPAGGEIRAIDPGDYFPVRITKAISIVGASAGAAGVLAIPPGAEGITVSAGATDKVFLKNLLISDARQGAASGIHVKSAGSIVIANCVLRDVANFGLFLGPNVPLTFTIVDTRLEAATLRVEPTSNLAATGDISNVTIDVDRIANGIEIMSSTGPTTVSISDTRVSGASQAGIFIQAVFAPAIVSARNVVASNNGRDASPGGGFVVYRSIGFASAVLRLAHSVSTGGAYGVVADAALVESYGDNNLRGNVNGAVGLLGSPAGQFVTVANR